MNRRIIILIALGSLSACTLSTKNLLQDGTYSVAAQPVIANVEAIEENGRLAITGAVHTVGRATDHIYGRLHVTVTSPSGNVIENQSVCFHASKERIDMRRGSVPEYVEPTFEIYTEIPPKGSLITFDTTLGDESCHNAT